MIRSKFNGSVLEINTDDGIRRIDLGHEIGNILTTTEENVIVRFELVGSATPERNIMSLDKYGNTVWRVEDPGMWRVGREIWPTDHFGGMGFDEKGDLWASGGESRYRIDSKTGKILEEIYTK